MLFCYVPIRSSLQSKNNENLLVLSEILNIITAHQILDINLDQCQFYLATVIDNDQARGSVYTVYI